MIKRCGTLLLTRVFAAVAGGGVLRVGAGRCREAGRLRRSASAPSTTHARIVELRSFAGLSIEETAHVLDRSPATIKRAWRLAKAWLYKELRLT